MVSHGWYLLAPFRWSSAEGTLRRVELLGGKPVALTITHRAGALNVILSRPFDSRLRRSLRAGSDGEASQPPRSFAPLRMTVMDEMRVKMTRMFQLHVETAEFVVLASQSDEHRWVAAAGFGRLLCGSTPFEDAVKIIATTNTTWRQTVRMVELLVGKCGRGGVFPEPRDIVRFSIHDLQRDCRLGYRATSVHRLAAGVVDGSIDLAAIRDPAQTTEELFASYRTLPGIGPYGAAHLLAMDGRHDFIAVDSEFRRFVRERYHRGRRVTDSTMLRRYNKWGRWKYLAYWSELWASVAERLQQTTADK